MRSMDAPLSDRGGTTIGGLLPSGQRVSSVTSVMESQPTLTDDLPPPSAVSSRSSTVSFTPPRGPISAFDYRPESKRAIFFEEKQNVLVEQDVDNLEKTLLVVPKEYTFITHFWARVYYVNSSTILALLKEHAQREFILVSFRLRRKENLAVKLDERRTEICTDGYQISSQRGRAEGEFCFGLCSRAVNLGHKRKHSERTKFMRQLLELHEKEEQKHNGLQQSLQAKRSVSNDEETSHFGRSHPSGTKTHESVMLAVKCASESGAIAMNVLLVGRKRLGIKRPPFGWDLPRFKYTSRLNMKEAEHLVEPIQTELNALFINGRNPHSAILVPMRDVPTGSAPMAAIEQLQRQLVGKGQKQASGVEVRVSGEAPPSTEHSVWSNLEGVDNPRAAFLVIQNEHLVTSLWKLNIEKDDGTQLRWERIARSLQSLGEDCKAERLSLRVHADSMCVRGCVSRKESPEEVKQFCEAFNLVNIAAN